MVMSAVCLAGCGHGDNVWVTGVLKKGGEIYKPPEGRKLALYFCPMADGTSGKTTGEVEVADYDSRDGSFTVPGREGYGIPTGRYRIAVIETYRRETVDKLNSSSSGKLKGNRAPKRSDDENNLLEATFGENTSPFVRDLTSSTKLTLDMANPAQ
jgi:hypothetical protein